MRKKRQNQMPLMPPTIDHPQARELETISRIIDENSTICDYVMQDLCKGRSVAKRSGANGMTAEQVLCAAIVKMLYGFTYQQLAFHMVDSQSIRRFCQIGFADKGFKKSVLNKNIKALSESTWQAINRELTGYTRNQNIEKGRQVRIDCTVVESNIHPPSESSAACKKTYGGNPIRQKQQTTKTVVQRSTESDP